MYHGLNYAVFPPVTATHWLPTTSKSQPRPRSILSILGDHDNPSVNPKPPFRALPLRPFETQPSRCSHRRPSSAVLRALFDFSIVLTFHFPRKSFSTSPLLPLAASRPKTGGNSFFFSVKPRKLWENAAE